MFFRPALILTSIATLASHAPAADSPTGLPPAPAPGARMSPAGFPAVLTAEDVKALADPNGTSLDTIYQKAATLWKAGKWDEAGSWVVAARWAEFARQQGSPLPPLLTTQFLQRPDWMAAFVGNITPGDKKSEVAAILGSISKAEPQQFCTYLNLALAVSFVYDQSPPKGWPHSQVSTTALSRAPKDPLEVFRFFVSSQTKGRLLENPAKMEVRELIYVVDIAPSFAEITEAQQRFGNRSRLPGLYSSIKYDHPRADTGVYSWPYETYGLEDIAKKGGICVDQAYYMSQISKGLGVPAVIFCGGGQDGYHAWVAYQEKPGKWNMNVGRYAEHKYAVGHGYDPQNWRQSSDWDLAYLAERFFEAPRYRESMVANLMGDVFESKLKDSKSAAIAYRASVDAEKRNASAWGDLVRVYQEAKATPQQIEPVLEAAATALTRYADLEAEYRSQLADSMEKRGDAEGAAKMRQRLMRRYVEARPDLALDQAGKRLRQMMERGSLTGDIRREYNSLMLYFDDAGTAAWDTLTEPFVAFLQKQKENKAALDAVRTARRKLKPKPDSQLEKYMTELEKELGKA